LPSDAAKPLEIRIKRTNDPYADQEARWHLVRRYLVGVLEEEKMDPTIYLAATNAAYEIETKGNFTFGAGPTAYREGGLVLHGLRIRLSKLLLAYRERHRVPESSQEHVPDDVFLRRWTKASRIFGYHDRHFVRRCQDEQVRMPADLAFPDDGRTTVFQLGRRVWFDERELEERERTGIVNCAQSHPSKVS
jgi:hypothetical protein